jgi:hypothetical protein
MDRHSGIAPTKTLAKLANHVAKKDEKHGGVVLLLDEVAQDVAWRASSSPICGASPTGWRRV